MTTLSLAMIVKNEAETLERILTCAKGFCDELVVVDTGSTDKTVKIAEKAGAKVFHFAWTDNFAEARNYAFDCTSGDWIIWLDADDFVPESEQAKIREIKQALSQRPDIDVVCMNYHYLTPDSNQPEITIVRERMIRRSAGLKWVSPLHEQIEYDESRALLRADILIEHRPSAHKSKEKAVRDFEILQGVIQRGEATSRLYYLYAEELRRNHGKFEEAMDAYRHAFSLSELSWEKYAILIGQCQCAFQLGEPNLAFQYANEALAIDSQRAEAFNQLGLHFFGRQEWQKAIPFFRAASALPKPGEGFTADYDYSWLPREHLAHCYMHLARYDEAIDQVMEILPYHPYPQNIAEFLRQVMQYV